MGDRYAITECIGRGGMAEVYRGVAESLQGFKKAIAIKRILPSLAKSEKFVAMFLDEARLSLYLQHANIVHVFDIGKSESSYFLVMEYIDGANLKGILDYLESRGRRMDPSHAVYLMIEACKGLHYAHTLTHPETDEPLHIVHRDISPPNLLVSKMGEVKLVDFGLAKANSQLEETDQGVVKGKFSYLSPEAAHGTNVDHRADIFAVGIMLWEMLTGKRLFFGQNDYETVQLVREARVPSITAINPKIDGELEQVVRKALARDPAHRYQEAAELGDALSHYLFSKQMKVTARSIAELIKEMKSFKLGRTTGRSSIVDELVAVETEQLTSLLQDEPAAKQDENHDTNNSDGDFVDTSTWLDEFGLD